MYFYFSYVTIFTVTKNYYPKIYYGKERVFIVINKLLNIFFTLFWWIFFTPYIEINSGVIGNFNSMNMIIKKSLK